MLSPLHSPAHPGAIIRDTLDGIAEEIGRKLTVGEVANALKTTRQNLSAILNGKGSVTPEMAFKLSKAIGSSPEFWIRLQEQYDLADVRKRVSTESVQVLWASAHESMKYEPPRKF